MCPPTESTHLHVLDPCMAGGVHVVHLLAYEVNDDTGPGARGCIWGRERGSDAADEGWDRLPPLHGSLSSDTFD